MNEISKRDDDKMPARRTSRSSAVVNSNDIKAAISLIQSAFEGGGEDVSKERLRDASEHIKKTARRLFVIAKAIDEVLDERD